MPEHNSQLDEDSQNQSLSPVLNKDRPLPVQKRHDLAALLPICGVLFFATPLISTLTSEGSTGIGGTAFYIFTMWALLIVAAFVLARILRGHETDRDEVN